jgi:selenide,water dikinase
MTTLNAGAWRVMRAARVNAATDVTGFGLLGHLREMIVASEVAARVNVSSIPILPGVEELAGTGVYSGGTERNLAAAQTYTDFGDTPEPTRVVMADAQTSGGLLIAVPPARSDQILDALDGSVGPQARAIGHVVEGPARIYAV